LFAALTSRPLHFTAYDGEIVIATAGTLATVQGDIPFTPTIYFDGAYHPVCFDDVSDGANTVCMAAGFPYGGRVVNKKTGNVLEQNAMLVNTSLPAKCH
jgi:hypothetical protein